MKKSINQIREEELRKVLNNNPSGAKAIAEAAISSLPYSMLKRLTECLDIEAQCQRIKKYK